MTRLEALEQLATGVMGVKRPPNILWRDTGNFSQKSKVLLEWYDDPANYPCIDVFASCSPVAIRWKHGEAAKPYRPDRDPAQAMDLAEAWCRQKPEHRLMEIEFIPSLSRWTVHLWKEQVARMDGHYATDRAAALTGAVYEAEGIKVEE